MIVNEYFSRHGAPCPIGFNPAEHMLEAIGAGLSPRIGPRDWAEIWNSSTECEQVCEEIQHIKLQGIVSHPDNNNASTQYATPFLYQLKTVALREFVALWRSPDYICTKLCMHASVALVVALAFLQLENGVRDLQSRVFVMLVLSALLRRSLMNERPDSGLKYCLRLSWVSWSLVGSSIEVRLLHSLKHSSTKRIYQ